MFNKKLSLFIKGIWFLTGVVLHIVFLIVYLIAVVLFVWEGM